MQYEAVEGTDPLARLNDLRRPSLQAKVNTKGKRTGGAQSKGGVGGRERLQGSKESKEESNEEGSMGTCWMKNELNRINASKVLTVVGFVHSLRTHNALTAGTQRDGLR
jgi:hypothetical protein